MTIGGRSMPRKPSLVAGLGIIVIALAARAEETKLARDAQLVATPAGASAVGEVAAGTPVTIVGREGSWVRIRVEGWLPADAIANAPAPAAAAVAVATPTQAGTAALPGNARLEGTLEIQHAGWMRKKKLTGAGRQIWLLPASFDVEGAGQVSADEQAQIDQLDADAARLTREAEKAMHGSSFTDSTRKHDELIKQRDQVLAKRTAILGLHHGRREAAARQAALASATCDARGFYAFPSIAPGGYRVYARLVERDLDLEWIEAVDIGAASLAAPHDRRVRVR